MNDIPVEYMQTARSGKRTYLEISKILQTQSMQTKEVFMNDPAEDYYERRNQ